MHHGSLTVLPEDLKREIFEIYAHSRPVFIPTLMLVARRVKIWVEPLLYRTIVLGTCENRLDDQPIPRWETLVSILESKPASFFRTATRNLFWFANEHEKRLVMQCRGIENLWMGGLRTDVAQMFPLVEDLPLQRLYCNLAYLFGSERQIDFTHRLFSRIKHLELFDPCFKRFAPTIWCNLALIPHLTHLAVHRSTTITVWLTLLRACHSLRIFVVLVLYHARASIDGHQDKAQLVNDPRFVTLYCAESTQDWQMGARTGLDYWSRAEDLVAKRRSGEINSLQYWIEIDESSYIA
ncbi:hypothetical protein B0H19DRAFT_1374738 [Mycena capillaripes]|nr:hypothetical protein B0H19DRAFT_1374738 [Mycena capillaripes]